MGKYYYYIQFVILKLRQETVRSCFILVSYQGAL